MQVGENFQVDLCDKKTNVIIDHQHEKVGM